MDELVLAGELNSLLIRALCVEPALLEPGQLRIDDRQAVGERFWIALGPGSELCAMRGDGRRSDRARAVLREVLLQTRLVALPERFVLRGLAAQCGDHRELTRIAIDQQPKPHLTDAREKAVSLAFHVRERMPESRSE